MRISPMRGFELTPTIIGFEIASLLIIIFVSFFIYIKTKDLYKLTQHKAILYFRNGFFFFGIGGILSLFQTILIITKFHRIIGINMRLFFIITSIFTLIGVFYLLFSIFSKQIKNDHYIYLFIPTIIIFIFFIREKFIITLIHFTILGLILIGSYINYKKHKPKKFISKTFMIYILLFTFWTLNSLRFWINYNLNFSREIFAIVNALIFIYIFYVFEKRFLKSDKNSQTSKADVPNKK